MDESPDSAAAAAAAGTIGKAAGKPRPPIELKVEYKKMNTFFADYAKNISRGGTFIKTDRPLPVGTSFVFKLILPRRDVPFALRGTVAWTNSGTESQRPDQPEQGMGIRFVYDGDAERQRFEAEVEELMVASLGSALFARLVPARAALV